MSTPKYIPLDDTSRHEPQLWPQLSDTDWVALHVPRCAELRPRFEECARALTAVLNRAKKKLAPEAIIQVRAKELPSFAEKILRKKGTYVDPKIALPPDPLMRLTDLCGGRVICQTEAQVQAIRGFLERHFEIDWANSDDASERLGTTEFGYRTINRIVSFKAGAFPEDIVPADLCGPIAVPGLSATMPLKMEIQVRTMLEHAWADVSHDLAYKTDVTLPARIKRDLAGKAAILEETDGDIARLVAVLEHYRTHYGAHQPRKKVEEEIALQNIVLAHIDDPVKSAALAVRIATLHLAIGNQARAVGVLDPFAADTAHHAVQRTLGQALIELHGDHPGGADFARGHACLRHATTADGADAETFCLLGEAELLSGNNVAAGEAYHDAITLCSGAEPEPVSLARYLEHEVAQKENLGLVRLAEPMIRGAMQRCRAQIDGCVNLPGAWAALSLLHLLVKEPHAALDALAHLMCLCDARQEHAPPPQPCAAARHVHRLRRAVQRIFTNRENLPGYDAVARALLVALAVRGRDEAALAELAQLASWHERREPSHLNADMKAFIVSGGCAPEIERQVADLEPHLRRAFEGLPPAGQSWLLVSGGTTAGISRLVGDVTRASGGAIKSCGYLPATVPPRYVIDHDDRRYTWLRESAGNDFTALDPLQGWTDMAAAGLTKDNLRHVKLIAFAPGEISRAEIAFALALGVRVGIIDHPDLPPLRQFDGASWWNHLAEGALISLPLDAMTIRAFLLANDVPEKNPTYESAARMAHENYLKSAKPMEPSLLPWDQLPEVLQLSNFHQVAYWRDILAIEGLGVRAIPKGASPPLLDMRAAIGDDGIRRLAEKEHGRWNVERLLRGWRLAATKDVSKKLSPYLVPWDSLSTEIQGYDVSAVIELPKNLQVAGLEVYHLPG